MCFESATAQGQRDSTALMGCLFKHSCYDRTCLDGLDDRGTRSAPEGSADAISNCRVELEICHPTITPVSGSLVER